MIWKTWEIFLFVDAAYCSVKRFPLFNLRKGKSRWVLLDIFIVCMVCSSSFRCSFHRFSWFDYKDHEDVGNLNDFIVIQEEVVLGSIMTQLFCLVIFFPTSSHQIPTCRGGGVLQTGVCLCGNDRVVYMLVPETGHAFRPGSPRGTGKKSWRLRMRCLVQAQGTYVYIYMQPYLPNFRMVLCFCLRFD